MRRPPRSTLFPYTTLSRSAPLHRVGQPPPRRDRPAVAGAAEVPQGAERVAVLLGVVGPRQVPRRRVRRRAEDAVEAALDRKSTRLNSSHLVISYAVFCLKK